MYTPPDRQARILGRLLCMCVLLKPEPALGAVLAHLPGSRSLCHMVKRPDGVENHLNNKKEKEGIPSLVKRPDGVENRLNSEKEEIPSHSCVLSCVVNILSFTRES